MSSVSTATPMEHEFERRVNEFHSLKSEINSLILDYLTIEGYPRAAAKFSREANLAHPEDDQLIEQRRMIQTSIHAGKIQDAISALNDLEPEILDKDTKLHFSLLRLQLVELIRECIVSPGADITPALTFAQTHLAPRAPTDPQFLQDLEQTMALIVFSPDGLEPQLASLLHPDLRRRVADDVNKAILERQAGRREAAIRQLIHMRSWAENTARQQHIRLPERLPLGLKGDTFEACPSHDQTDEPMSSL